MLASYKKTFVIIIIVIYHDGTDVKDWLVTFQ